MELFSVWHLPDGFAFRQPIVVKPDISLQLKSLQDCFEWIMLYSKSRDLRLSRRFCSLNETRLIIGKAMLRRLLTAAGIIFSFHSPAAFAETDPLQIVVSIREQKMRVFRGVEPIAEVPVSSGKPGHATPTGVFSILHKRKFHRSNLYSNAPMPWMQRLTWTGIALHEGKLPGYPASHGCVRLPEGFAEELFGMTSPGAHVVITGDMIEPRLVEHPVLPQPQPAPVATPVSHVPVPEHGAATRLADIRPALMVNDAAASSGAEVKLPVRILITRANRGDIVASAQGMLSRLGYYDGPIDGLIGPKTSAAIKAFQELHNLPKTGTVTSATRTALFKTLGVKEPATGKLYVRSGFEPVFEAAIEIANVELPLGTHLLTATEFDKQAGKTRWQALTLENRLSDYARAIHGIDKDANDYSSTESALSRIRIPQNVSERLSAMLTPGSSITISDTGLGPYTGWKTDFVVTTKIEPRG
jgi:peptidoglycan hydrolase-like protein with peptidoglycan-binding domain